MSGFPSNYGEGMNAFEFALPRGPYDSPQLALEKIPVDSFNAVANALRSMGFDVGQAILDPRVARLAEDLFYAASKPPEAIV